MRHIETNQEKRSEIIAQTRKFLDLLGEYGISHGDMKTSNILLADGALVLTDLDAMRVHRWRCAHRLGQSKDTRRLARDQAKHEG